MQGLGTVVQMFVWTGQWEKRESGEGLKERCEDGVLRHWFCQFVWSQAYLQIHPVMRGWRGLFRMTASGKFVLALKHGRVWVKGQTYAGCHSFSGLSLEMHSEGMASRRLQLVMGSYWAVCAVLVIHDQVPPAPSPTCGRTTFLQIHGRTCGPVVPYILSSSWWSYKTYKNAISFFSKQVQPFHKLELKLCVYIGIWKSLTGQSYFAHSSVVFTLWCMTLF